MGIKITDMSPDASIGGSELIPASDSGSPKSVTLADIKNYTIDQIEAIAAGSSVSGSDGIYALQSGVLKPVDIDLVCQRAIDTVWGKAAETAPDNADVMALKDGGTTEKTVTLSKLAEYVRSTVEAAILDVSDLTKFSSLADVDKFLVTQGTTGKYIEFSDIKSAVLGALAAYVTALTEVTSVNTGDELYILQGGTARKTTVTKLAAQIGGNVSGPASTTANNVPQWGAVNSELVDGFGVVESVSDGSADHGSLATERAVRDAVDDAKAEIVPQEVDGALATGDNVDFAPIKLVYNKTCSDSTGDDVIDLHDGTNIGQIVTVYLGTKAGTDNAVITPVTALYNTITLNAVNEIATLQWQGSTVGWAILFTSGIVEVT